MPLEFVKKQKNSRHLVIFVHGFTGDSKTFFNSNDECLSSKLAKPVRDNCDFALFTYRSGWFDFLPETLYSIPFLGGLLGLKNENLEKYAAVLRTVYDSCSGYQSVNFLCHSMGGLIAKKVIIDVLNEGRAFRGFYITLATPHRGIEAAVNAARLHRHINALRPHSPVVQQTSQDWNGCAYRVKRCYISAIHDEIVSELSSCPAGEESLRLQVEGKHVDICKPKSSDDLVAITLSRKISEFLQLAPRRDPSDSEKDPLFISYRPSQEPYYVVRDIDRQLHPAVDPRNVWIHGPSGTGKTNIVQYLGSKLPGPAVYVDVSPSSETSAAMLTAVLDTLKLAWEQRGGSLSQPPAGVLNAICAIIADLRHRGHVTLIIDELGSAASAEFHSFVDAIVTVARVQQKSDASHPLRMVLCTLNCPYDDLSPDKIDALREYFDISSLEYWTPEEMLKLCEIIQAGLGCVLSKPQQAELLQYCRGSPRRMKTAFRQSIARSQESGIEAALQEYLRKEGVRA